MIRFGIDLGGTKIEIVALDDAGAELLRERCPTPQGDYLGTVMAIAGLVEAAERSLGLRGSVGVGIPGTESAQTGLIKNANSTCLIGQPLRRDLQAILQRQIRLANDANCFALSEATDGAGADGRVVFGVILGTGVGGGVVIDGKVIEGANRIAGEWGHNALSGERAGLRCYCGRTDCVETYLSGPGMVADYVRVSGQHYHGAPAGIVRAAEDGDATAEAAVRRYEERLARALAQVINIVDPDVIVLGGGLSNIDRLYENVPRLWGRHVFSDSVVTALKRHHHGDSSGVRGAAWLWQTAMNAGQP